jgi:hypothetical protein
MDRSEWWIEQEYLDRNLVVVKVAHDINLWHEGSLTDVAQHLIREIKSKLFVEEHFGGVFDPDVRDELHFQYPTEKVLKSGNYYRVSIPANMLRTKRDFVTIRRNEDGSITIFP